MKILKQKISKQIMITLLILIMLFDIFQPISNAAEGHYGKLFVPIMNLVATVADLGIELLQKFLWDGSVINKDNNYEVYIGPATIFAGKIPRIGCQFYKSKERIRDNKNQRGSCKRLCYDI